MSDQPGGPDWEHGSDGKWYGPGVLSGAGWQLAGDGLWYAPQAASVPPMAGAPGQYYAQPPKKKTSGCLISLAVVGGLVVLLIAVVAIAGGGSDSADDASTDGGGSNSNAASDSTTASDSTAGPDSSAGSGASGDSDEVDDVVLADCTTDELGFMVAALTITNNSEDSSDYQVDVAFQSPDGATSFADGFAFETNIGSGQTRQAEVNALTEAPAEPFECVVLDVERTASL